MLDGARKGLTAVLQGPRITVGRHPEASLQLHPERDLDVSTRHAVLARGPDGWFVRDLASRNGTFVNDRPVEGDVPVGPGDRIRFGSRGPTVRLEDPRGRAEDVPGTAQRPAEEAPDEEEAEHRRVGSTTEWVRVQVAEHTRRLRWIALGVSFLFMAVALLVLLKDWNRRASWEEERERMESEIDSILAEGDRAVGDMRGEVEGLTRALEASRERIRELREALAGVRAEEDTADLAALRRRLQAATVALTRQQLAASLDFESVRRVNGRALALVYAEMPGGGVVSATAFAVDSAGLLLTNRHVLTAPGSGERATRIAVQFSGSRQVWPARVAAVSDSVDLAVLRVRGVVGGVPRVEALNARPDTLRSGSPVTLMGFPLGGDEYASAADRPAPVPLVSAGVIVRTGPDRMEIQGYGAEGASGSPVFDGDGEVVAVLFGGRSDPGGRTVVAIPIDAVSGLLEAARRGRMR